VAATLGNIGPGLGSVEPTDNYAHIPLAGRLEIHTVLIMLATSFWKK